MDFQEMQVIWNSQQEQTMYAIDSEALHRQLQRRAKRIERELSLAEIGIMIITLITAAQQAWNPIFRGEDYYQIFGAVVMLGVGAWMFRMRQHRRQIRSQFEATMLGDLDCAIEESKAHLFLARNFHWWFLAPACAIILVRFWVEDHSRSAGSILITIGGFVLALTVVHLAIRCYQAPEQKELQSLRDTLTSEI
jgi:hypothetical protein